MESLLSTISLLKQLLPNWYLQFLYNSPITTLIVTYLAFRIIKENIIMGYKAAWDLVELAYQQKVREYFMPKGVILPERKIETNAIEDKSQLQKQRIKYESDNIEREDIHDSNETIYEEDDIEIINESDEIDDIDETNESTSETTVLALPDMRDSKDRVEE